MRTRMRGGVGGEGRPFPLSRLSSRMPARRGRRLVPSPAPLLSRLKHSPSQSVHLLFRIERTSFTKGGQPIDCETLSCRRVSFGLSLVWRVSQAQKELSSERHDLCASDRRQRTTDSAQPARGPRCRRCRVDRIRIPEVQTARGHPMLHETVADDESEGQGDITRKPCLRIIPRK
jgi:hypothetical protein